MVYYCRLQYHYFFLGINSVILIIIFDYIKIMRVIKLGYIEKFKAKLVIILEKIDMSLISFYLGLKLKRNCQKQFLKLFHPTYIEKILEKYNLCHNKPYNILMKQKILLPNQNLEVCQAKKDDIKG